MESLKKLSARGAVVGLLGAFVPSRLAPDDTLRQEPTSSPPLGTSGNTRPRPGRHPQSENTSSTPSLREPVESHRKPSSNRRRPRQGHDKTSKQLQAPGRRMRCALSPPPRNVGRRQGAWRADTPLWFCSRDRLGPGNQSPKDGASLSSWLACVALARNIRRGRSSAARNPCSRCSRASPSQASWRTVS